MKIAIYIKIWMILCISIVTIHANTYTDNYRNLMWQDDESVKTTQKNWEKAIEHCENLSFDGYSDWRLPNKSELRSILEFQGKDFFGGEYMIKNFSRASFYWSSTPHDTFSFQAWAQERAPFPRNKSDKLLVRCVRDNK